MNVQRGHSLIEVIVALTLTSIVAAIAVTLFRAATSETDESLASRLLESAAAAQESYRVNRGVFATTPQTFADLSAGEASFVSGASQDSSSVSAVLLPDGSLGLAVLVSAGKCAVLKVTTSGAAPLPRIISLGGVAACSGSLAG